MKFFDKDGKMIPAKSKPPVGVSFNDWDVPDDVKSEFHQRKCKDAKRYRRKYSERMRTNAKARYYRRRIPFMDKVKERRSRIKEEVYDQYGHFCACCGESNKAFLSIDHIFGGGTAHRKKNYWVYEDIKKHGFPKDLYQILCMNCNWGKRFRSECPHKTELRKIVPLEVLA